MSAMNGTQPESPVVHQQHTLLGKKDLLENVKQAWKKSRDQKGFSKSLGREVDYALFDPIKDVLEKAPKGDVKAIVTQLTNLVEDKDYKNGIDDCIRWLLLYSAIENDLYGKETEAQGPSAAMNDSLDLERNVYIQITQIVVSIAPYLAFENPYKSAGTSDIKKGCSDKAHKEHKKSAKSTPFHMAAKEGNARAVEQMISQSRRFCKEQLTIKKRRTIVSDHDAALEASRPNHQDHDLLLEILRQPDPASTSGETALHLAAIAEEGCQRTIRALLDFDTRVASSPDKTFEYALKNGLVPVVETFLGYESLRKAFVTSPNVIQAMEQLGDLQLVDSDRESRVEIVHSMINFADTHEILDDTVVEKIIELKLQDIWKQKKLGNRLDTSGLLHLAVRHQNVDFVEMFLQDYPDSVTHTVPYHTAEGAEKTTGKYALWHNNFVSEGSQLVDRKESEEKRQIRNAIVVKTIKRVKKMQKLSDIFQDSGEVVHELCFDLSRFNSKTYHVSDFVRSLINHKEHAELLRYECTIKYAEFPPLDLDSDDREAFGESVHAEHTEVFDILDWLKKKKGVEKIIELIVPDRLVNPHNEMKIATYVEDFQVEMLNWRFLDLSISVFEKGARDRITDLQLYSSGKRAAISHWLSDEGVISLSKLSSLDIYVIQELMTKKQCSETVEYIRNEFESFKIDRGRKTLDVQVTPQLWNPTHERLADLDEIAERAIPKLSRFIKKYRTYADAQRERGLIKSKPTKVAIIDNGILSISPRAEASRGYPNTRKRQQPNIGTLNASDIRKMHAEGPNLDDGNTRPTDSGISKSYRTLWSRIEDGRSFVDDDFRVSPWLFASDPHGTQMANLICAIDPLCQLYVAKVTDGRYGITPQRVARAIEWAIDQGVDIISMSFAILDTNERLRKACAKADDKGIVMVCSTHDEGSNISESWPAEYGQAITITACDEYGGLPRNTTETYDYGLHGLDVAAGVVPFLESNDRISGSSVATAIAAGLSSLILSCDRLAHPGKKYEGYDRKNMVEIQLKKMRSSKQEKYVILERFADIDLKIKDGLDINVEGILEQSFGKKPD